MTVTDTVRRRPPSWGIVTSHDDRVGHWVGAGWPSTRATTWPVRGLTKPLPWSVTTVPGRPRAGEIEASRGPAAAGAGVVVVVLVLVVVVLGLVVVLGVVEVVLVLLLGAGLVVVDDAGGNVGTAADRCGAGGDR